MSVGVTPTVSCVSWQVLWEWSCPCVASSRAAICGHLVKLKMEPAKSQVQVPTNGDEGEAGFGACHENQSSDFLLR